MNNKCNTCAKFLTCNRKDCKRITFVQAKILDKPKNIETTKSTIIDFRISTEEFGKKLQRFAEEFMKTAQGEK